MSNWKPNKEQQRYLDTIISMTVDCSMGKGTVDRETYTMNLRTMCDLIDKIPEEVTGADRGGRK